MGWRGAPGGARGLVWTLKVGKAETAVYIILDPRSRAKSSPSEVDGRNTITREMGPSCWIVQVCKISVWRVGTHGPVPIPGLVPAPGLTLTSILLVHVSHTHITTLAAQS